MRIISLLKAVMSQDMEMFKYKSKKEKSDLSKVLSPLLLGLLVMLSVGMIYYPIALGLKEVDKSYIILSISIAFPSILAFLEGIYKSQSILFEAKDNDLLFSLPITRKEILFSRITKLSVFQFLYSLLYIIPGIVIYIYFENPGVYFYIITTIGLLLFPIIPTVVGSILGYIIKRFSVNFKAQKIVQLITTLTLVSLIMIASFNSQGILQSIINNAESVNESINNYYYPAKAYTELIAEFNAITLIKLISLNILFVAIFLLIADKKYFMIISKSKENVKVFDKRDNKKEIKYNQKSVTFALVKKELIKYFSSTVYVFNTVFGLVLLLIVTVSLCINFEGALTYISAGEISAEEIETLHLLAPKLYLAILIGMSFLCSITSSSISIEGKSFNITKSLPAKVEQILFAKVLMSNIITIPAILISDIIFLVSIGASIIDSLMILVTSFVAPSIAAVFGLIINLKYPKMDASSDTEVVKQSLSSLVAVLGGIMLSGVFIVITFVFAGISIEYGLIFEVLILTGILALLWTVLASYGKKRFKQIEV